MKRISLRHFLKKIQKNSAHSTSPESGSGRSQEQEVRALATLARARRDAAHLLEARARLASMEAKSYADQGLSALGSSMRAAHTVVAKTTKRVDELERSVGEGGNFMHKLAELERRVDDKITGFPWQEEVNTALRNLERDVSGLFQNHEQQMRSIEERIEFVRSETMYELQAALLKSRGAAEQNASPVAQAQILNPEKLARMRASGLRLNIGCGHIQPEGFLNVDGRALPGIDIVAEASAVPLSEGETEEIFSSHLVEHFTRHMLERVILPHWASLLQQGGTLTTVAPDGAAMLNAVQTGEMTFEDFREVLFGGQDYDGDFHYNLITPDDFSTVLERVGFTDITREYVGKRNGKCFEFKIAARKR